mmetsp:Transcript_55086/g.172719  ORF Transcript_55086/g.172719 Transcript_55086/m.172719 type:complete len:242 (+) Transcript_55086:238-963(+)
MDDSVREGAHDIQQGRIEDCAPGDEKQDDRRARQHQQPTLHGTERHASDHRRPVRVVVLLQEENPNDDGQDHADKRRGLQDDGKHQLHHEENRIVRLEVVDVGRQSRTPIRGRWHRERQQEFLPGLGLLEESASLLLHRLQRCRHRCIRCALHCLAEHALRNGEVAAHEGAADGAGGGSGGDGSSAHGSCSAHGACSCAFFSLGHAARRQLGLLCGVAKGHRLRREVHRAPGAGVEAVRAP